MATVRWKCPSLFLLLLCFVSIASSAVYAATPRSQAGNALRQAKKDADRVVKDVSSFLQASGRWTPPKGDDMALCQSLQTFQQQLERLERDNNGQRGVSVVQSQLQQLQFMTGTLDQQLYKAAGNPALLTNWYAVKADLNNASQFIMPYVYGRSNLYDLDPSNPAGAFPNTGGSPLVPSGGMVPSPNPYIPGDNRSFPGGGGSFFPGGSNVPGYYPAQILPGGNTATSYKHVQASIRAAEPILDHLIPQVATFLQSAGKWPPAQASPEMQLCQELQYFQQQLRRFGDEVNAQTPYPVLQSQVQQLSTSFGNLDRLFFQTGATGEINGRWNELRLQLNNVYQAFYSAGGQQFWTR